MKEITKRVLVISIYFLAMGLSEPLFAQEKIIKDFAEERRQRKYCLYPSTLRMINISNNEAYNEIVKEIDKILIYQLDSTTNASKIYLDLVKYYQEADFQEYITVYGGAYTMYIYGKEGRKNQIMGVFAKKEFSLAFYLRGTVAWQKIPELINTLSENDMINLLDIEELR